MAKSPTKSSTPRLSEVARHLVIPEGIVTTGWPSVKAKGVELGINYDPWQDSAGRVMLGKRASGKYAATVGGIVWSIPRQVGKTYTIGTLLVIMCILFPGLKVVWTAHRTRTATDTFRVMQGIAKWPKVAPHVSHIRTANGEQEIGFRNGSVIMFGAREQGFGRGFTNLDVEVFDEAQILGEKALEDMIAATNQARHPHGALLFYIGTPPRPVDSSEAFTKKRQKALSGESTDMFYLELSADPDSDLDDRAQWPVMNLSYPKRTPLESMLRLRENLPSDDAWNREGRGVWDSDGRPKILGNWADGAVDAFALEPVGAVGVAISHDRAWASFGVADLRAGVMHVGTHMRAEGTAWVAAEARRIYQTYGCPIVVDKHGPGSDLIDDLQDANAWVVPVITHDYLDGCAQLFDAVAQGRVVHRKDDPDLNAAVAGAGQRKVSDRWAWSRQKSETDVSPLEAVTLAAWGVNYIKGGVIMR